ncbi:TPA: hypothetical protein PSJ07_002657 [Staphylococcus aureus]|nr:hypothetical protein [Staphylococcus aureus]
MKLIDFNKLQEIIEEKGIINYDEYIESIEQAKADLNVQTEELNKVVIDVLRAVRATGDEDFFTSVQNEVNNIDAELDDALEKLNLMQDQLNDMKEQSDSSDLQERLNSLTTLDKQFDNIITSLNDKFEGAPESVKAVNKFNE